MLITISGLPGSGKTTVARLVAEALGLEHVYAGDLFRRQAEAQGLTLEEYARRAETDHSIDQALDAKMRERAAQGNAVLEGRLAAFMAEQAGMAALRVFLDAAEPVRAERIVRREGGEAAARLRETQAREASDARRRVIPADAVDQLGDGHAPRPSPRACSTMRRASSSGVCPFVSSTRS